MSLRYGSEAYGRGIRFFVFVSYYRRTNKIQWDGTSAVRIDFRKAYDLVRREALYNISIGFGTHTKLAGIIKMCLNQTCRSPYR